MAPGDDDAAVGDLTRCDALPEPADLPQLPAADRHVRGDRIADRCDLGRQSGVAAAEHPIELRGKPLRLRSGPVGHELAGDADHVGVGEARVEALDPGGFRLGVVVREHDDVSPRDLDSRVAGADHPALVAVGDHLAAGEGLARPFEQPRVVVDDHDRLRGGERLSLDPAQAARELVAAIPAPARDDHGDAVLGGLRHGSEWIRRPLDPILGHENGYSRAAQAGDAVSASRTCTEAGEGWWARLMVRRLRASLRIVPSTRKPSRKVFRLLCPEIRSAS